MVEMTSVSRITVISSDGRVAARMSDYRPYLDPAYRPEFDDFLVEYGKHGVVTTDPANIREREQAGSPWPIGARRKRDPWRCA